MRLSAQEIYDKLLNVDHILELEGQIKFFLGDVNIIVRQKECYGKCPRTAGIRRSATGSAASCTG